MAQIGDQTLGRTQSEERLQTVTVEAERPEWVRILSPGAVSVIVPDDFKGEQKKLPDYLRAVPGLHIETRGDADQFTTLTMRGSSSAQVNVYVDGVPQNLHGDMAFDISLVNMNNVARIEVYRGYIPARFAGAAIGGVINIVTKRPEGYGVGISAGIRSLSGRTVDATVTGPLFGGSLLLGVHRDQSHGDFKYKFFSRTHQRGCESPPYFPYPCTRWRKSNSHQITDILLKWQDQNWYTKFNWKRNDRFFPSETGPSNYLLGLGGVDYADTWFRNQLTDQYEIQIGRRQRWGNLDFGLEVNYLNQKKDFKLMNVFWYPQNFNLNYIRRAGEVWNNYKQDRYGFVVDASYKLGQSHLLELRTDLFKEKLEIDANKRYSLQGGGFGFGTEEPFRNDMEVFHAQLSDTISLNESKDLKLTLIGRYDKVKSSNILKQLYYKWRDYVQPYWTWGAALEKNIGDSWTIRATGGSYVRHPNYYELFGDGVYVVPIVGDADYVPPQPETGRQWDIGVDWRGQIFNAKTNFSVTYFGRSIDNYITPRYLFLYGVIQYANGGITEARGLEFDLGLHSKKFDLEASATWQKTMILEKIQNGFRAPEGTPLPMMPEWETNVRATYHLFDDDLSIFAEYHYTGALIDIWYNLNQTENFIRNPISTVNLGAHYKLPYNFSVSAGMNDVFNQGPKQRIKFQGNTPGDTEFFGLKMPPSGRTWYVSLDYVFGDGSATDSSGRGSTDSWLEDNSGASDFENAETRRSPFYIAPKLIYSTQKTSFGARDWEITPGGGGYAGWNPWYIYPQDAGPMPPIPGGSQTDPFLTGGLALGIDFHKISIVPLRLEVEASINYDSRLKRQGLPTKEMDWNEWYDFWVNGNFGNKGVLAVNGGQLPTFTQLYYRNSQAFFNLFFDFHNKSRFTPYIGVGVGLSFTKTRMLTAQQVDILTNNGGDMLLLQTAETEENDYVNFSWNASVGVSYQVTDNMALDLSYRYVETGFHDKTKGWKGKREQLVENQLGEYWATAQVFDGADLDFSDVHQMVVAARFSF
jgi:outer membrane receptor protein involved in Fe transport